MTLRVRIAAFAASLLLAASPLASASGQAPYARIEGRVHDPMGVPIAEARVVLQGTARWAASDSNGYYAIDFVPPGEATLRAYADGHSARLARLAVRAGEIRNQDFSLDALGNPAGVGRTPPDPYETPMPAPVRTRQALPGAWLDRLPLDRVEGALLLLPGVTSDSREGISLRGGQPWGTMRYLDGIPVSPGYQSLHVSTLITPPSGQLGLGTNALGELSATTGPASVMQGNASSGFVNLLSRTGSPDWIAAGSYEADEPFGLNHSTGFNRLQAAVGGALTTKISLFTAAVLEGHKSAESGFGAEQAPLFIVAGLDTTVAVPSTPFDPNSDTTFVDIFQYAVSRGECSDFAGSANPGIAGNYGLECRGIRIPRTTSSTWQLLGRMDFAIDPRNRLSVLGAASQDQERLFDYRSLYDPANLRAQRNWSRLVAVSWSRAWGRPETPLTTDFHLSWQTDRALSGPLTLQSELDSRDKFGGYLIAPLDFRFDFTTFPIDEELVTNYRENRPGSRRSPYNLENTAPYALIDRWRDGPYGLFGFIESGGPGGRINLHREDRVVATGQAQWRLNRHHTAALGVEYVDYSIASYTHELTSQAFSDVFIESPVRSAVFARDQWREGDFTLEGGLRIDHFSTGASRPWVLDTVATSPTFDRYHYFPSPSSYGAAGTTFNGKPLTMFVKDEGHTVISPALSLGFEADARTRFRAGYRLLAQVPNFALSLAGVNKDLRITSPNDVWGTNLGFQKTALYELGGHRMLGRYFGLDLSLYYKDLRQLPAIRSTSLRDPAALGSPVPVNLVTNQNVGSVRGFDLRVDVAAGSWLQGFAGYSFQDANGENGTSLAEQRPHTFAGGALLDVPHGWKAGTPLGAILSDVGLAAVFRFASGTAYDGCAAASGNILARSSDPCPALIQTVIGGDRLPTYQQLDLKLTKTLQLAGRRVTAYLDARNLLNFENTLAVFSSSKGTTNPAALQARWAQDSAGLATEAQYNGVYNYPSGDVDLSFGGAGTGACVNWLNPQFQAAAPNCVYLIRAEERYGNGDHVFSLVEQERASRAAFEATNQPASFLGPPRRLRLGVEIGF